MQPDPSEDNSTEVDRAYNLLCETDEVSYYLRLGMSVWYTGNKEVIDGRECMVFVLGTEHEDQFVKENYYAVYDAQVYYYDVIDDVWNILGAR